MAAKDHYRAIVLDHMSWLYDRAEGISCFVIDESEGALAETSKLLESFGRKCTLLAPAKTCQCMSNSH